MGAGRGGQRPHCGRCRGFHDHRSNARNVTARCPTWGAAQGHLRWLLRGQLEKIVSRALPSTEVCNSKTLSQKMGLHHSRLPTLQDTERRLMTGPTLSTACQTRDMLQPPGSRRNKKSHLAFVCSLISGLSWSNGNVLKHWHRRAGHT